MTNEIRILTANLQFTLHDILPAVIHGSARVHATVERARLPDLQRQNTFFAEHSVLGFIRDVHLVFVPGHFRLKRSD